MKWKILVSAPYMQPVIERFRPIFEEHDAEVVLPTVHERLSEDELLGLMGDIHGVVAGDDRFTVNAGVGYRLIATDWLAFHLNVRDHVFNTDLLGESETKHNIEFSGGMTLFF